MSVPTLLHVWVMIVSVSLARWSATGATILAVAHSGFLLWRLTRPREPVGCGHGLRLAQLRSWALRELEDVPAWHEGPPFSRHPADSPPSFMSPETSDVFYANTHPRRSAWDPQVRGSGR